MGMIFADIQVSTPWNGDQRALNALVDTGSLYTILPASLLEELGTERLRRVTFELADGSAFESDVGVAVVALDGHAAATLVAFGPDDVDPLLGAMTLQQLELALDMKNERIVPGHRLRL